MLETQFPRQDYQEWRIFKDENGIFSEDSATKCAKQVLLASGTDLQGRNTGVRCHLWGVVRSGVFNPSFSRFSFGCAGCNSSTCERLVSLHASYFTSCSCSALQWPFSLSRSGVAFFLFSDWWLVKERNRVNLDDLDWLKPLELASQALVQATAFAVLLYGFFALLSRPEKHMRYEMMYFMHNQHGLVHSLVHGISYARASKRCTGVFKSIHIV